jgi:hypothetical protein
MKTRWTGVFGVLALGLSGAACLDVAGVEDRLPPTVRFITPENHAVVSGIVNVEIEATDDTGIVLVRFFRANQLAAETRTPPYTFGWNSAQTQNGQVYLAAEVVDRVGNRAVAEISVTVQN